MIIQGKVWGNTSPVFNKNNVEVHYLNVHEGAFCSEHKHKYKFNKFIVIKGQLKVTVFKNYEDHILEEVTILTSGNEMIVNPGDYHKFEAIEDTELLEIYWVEMQEEDIFRRTVGGVKI